MKRISIFAILMLLVLTVSAGAQTLTSTGTLTVSATVGGSINLVFNTDASGVALTGSGTNAATLAFGNVSAYGVIGGNITRSVVAGTSFTVSTLVDVAVVKANSTSSTYTLTAKLGAADAVNTWQVGGATVTSASAATIISTGAYASTGSQTVALTIPFTEASGTNISNTLNFTATSN